MRYIYYKFKILIFSVNKKIFSTRLIIGLLSGGFLGFLYYLLTNITASPPSIATTPWIPTIYGLILGGLLSKS